MNWRTCDVCGSTTRVAPRESYGELSPDLARWVRDLCARCARGLRRRVEPAAEAEAA